MRRKDREVTDPAEMTSIMSRCEVLHLAINTGEAPYLLPVSFGMEPDGMTLYLHGAMTGRKYDLLARDNRVGFEMDCTHGLVLDDADHSCTVNYESVMGWGVIEKLTGEEEKRHALDRIMAQYHAEAFPYSAAPIPHTRLLRLRVEERTGKRRPKRMGGKSC